MGLFSFKDSTGTHTLSPSVLSYLGSVVRVPNLRSQVGWRLEPQRHESLPENITWELSEREPRWWWDVIIGRKRSWQSLEF